MSLRARGLGLQRNGRALVRELDLELQAGELLAVLGPNGAGKSTLLRMLSGELQPDQGVIEIDGLPLRKWKSGVLARRRAVLPQTEALRFGFSAEEVVRLGRLPWPAFREAEIARAALTATGAGHLAARRYTELSAGERSRVQLARVLAQIWEPVDDQPRYLLLDEPTASLDLAHQHEVLAATRAFAARAVGVIAVIHDPNLALLYADRSLIMSTGHVVACGPTPEILTAERVSSVFGIEVESIERPGDGPPWLAPRRRPIAGERRQNATS